MTDLGLKALTELKLMMGLAAKMHNMEWALAYDFRNFNAQHSRRDMRRYYTMLREAGARIDRSYLKAHGT